jgi:hypothetical protein
MDSPRMMKEIKRTNSHIQILTPILGSCHKITDKAVADGSRPENLKKRNKIFSKQKIKIHTFVTSCPSSMQIHIQAYKTNVSHHQRIFFYRKKLKIKFNCEKLKTLSLAKGFANISI